MLSVPIPDSLKDLVDDMTEIALTDASGKVVAVVVPPGHREMHYDMVFAQFESDMKGHPTSAEIREEIANGRTYTTAEVRAHLERLTGAEKRSACITP